MNTLKLRHLTISILMILFLVIVSDLKAQTRTVNEYFIKTQLDQKQAEDLDQALSKADFTNYRLRSKRVVLIFDNGIEVELYSANELKLNGKNINPEEYQVSFPEGYELPTFQLGSNGIILARYPKKDIK